MHYFDEWLLPEEQGKVPYLDNFNKWLDFISHQYAGQTALSDGNGSVSYDELAERVARRRGFLAEEGIAAGSQIGLFDLNSVEAVEWLLAITTAGCTAVMLPAQLSPEVLAGAADWYELSLLLAGEALFPKCGGVSVPVRPISSIGAEEAPAAAVTKETPAAIFFTSGTTGTPSGAILSHGALLRGAHNGSYRPRVSQFGQSVVTVLPLTHVFGMVFSTLAPLSCGAHVALCGRMPELFKEMQRVRPTTMIAVPGMAELLLHVAKSRGIEALGGRLKIIICGAAPVPPRLYEAFLPYGISVYAGYGLTETANLVSANYEMEKKPASVGRQYPAQEMRLVDGELQVRGDMLFSGYWKDPGKTRAAFTKDGWLRTGDLARIDEDGAIFIVGRIKNLILLPNGENVSPEEIEEQYYRSALVKDCLAYEGQISGSPAILLAVQPQPGVSEEMLLAEIDRVTETLPPLMRPARVILRREDFVKSGSMKIIRGAENTGAQENEKKREPHEHE